MLASSPALAQGAFADARLAVDLVFDAGTKPDLKEQAELAWPVVLDRVIPAADRSRIPTSIRPYNLLLKAQPVAGGSHIVFHTDRVWQAVQQANIAYIAEEPSFYLRLTLTNASGRNMPQSQQELMQATVQNQGLMGVNIVSAPLDNAPFLGVNIHWLSSSSFQLSVKSQSKLQEFSETVSVADDPVLAMQQALRDTLLRARDAYAVYPQSESEHAGVTALPVDAYARTNMLRISWNGNLSEQIFLEKKLRDDPRVLRLQPNVISRTEQVYTLELKNADDQWLRSWFASIGLRAERDAQGWQVRQP